MQSSCIVVTNVLVAVARRTGIIVWNVWNDNAGNRRGQGGGMISAGLAMRFIPNRVNAFRPHVGSQAQPAELMLAMSAWRTSKLSSLSNLNKSIAARRTSHMIATSILSNPHSTLWARLGEVPQELI